MWKYKYGEFSDKQISDIKDYLRGQIFFLLLIVDPKTCNDYKNINVCAAFDGTLHKIGGLNSILNYPPALVNIVATLEAAFIEYKSSDTIQNDFYIFQVLGLIYHSMDKLTFFLFFIKL